MTTAWVKAPLVRFLWLFCVLYLAFGASSPFLPSLFESRGIKPEELGLIFSSATAIRLLAAPIAARLADRFGALRSVLAACAAAASAASLCFLPASHFPAILVVSLLQAAALAPTSGLADALALGASRAKMRSGFEYGWVRGAGSAAFIVGSVIAGVAISGYGLVSILWLQAALLIAVPWAVRQVPATAAWQHEAERRSPVGVFALAKSAAFRRLVLFAALVLGSHAMHDTFAMIRWRAAGIPAWQTGLLWSLAVAGEVIVFFFVGPRLLKVLTPPGGLVLGLDLPFGPGAAQASTLSGTEVGIWVAIKPDDTVVIRIVRSEMGQGTITGLAQLVAEELECDWSKVTYEYPTPGEHVARKRVWGSFSTGGPTSRISLVFESCTALRSRGCTGTPSLASVAVAAASCTGVASM